MEVCWLDFTFTNLIELKVLHICDMLLTAVILRPYRILYHRFEYGDVACFVGDWLFKGSGSGKNKFVSGMIRFVVDMCKTILSEDYRLQSNLLYLFVSIKLTVVFGTNKRRWVTFYSKNSLSSCLRIKDQIVLFYSYFDE